MKQIFYLKPAVNAPKLRFDKKGRRNGHKMPEFLFPIQINMMPSLLIFKSTGNEDGSLRANSL